MDNQNFHSLPNVRASSTHLLENEELLHSHSMSNIKEDPKDSIAVLENRPSPYSLSWIHGFNSKVDIINLKNKSNCVLFYAASNCAVLLNWKTKKMHILQGHRNMVTNICSDIYGKWLVTADSGPENIITIWDASERFPHRTLFSPLGNTKISKIDLSKDAKYLMILGYHDKAILQWWIWSFGLETPHATLEVDLPREAVIMMSFNPNNSDQYVLMTRQEIWIGTCLKVDIKDRSGYETIGQKYVMKIRKPHYEVNSEIGKFTCFTFVKKTSQILVGSTRGAVIIFGYTINYQENVESSDIDNLRFNKALKVEKFRINVIKNIDGLVVTGNAIGEIHFYDVQLKLLYWTQYKDVNYIKGISFDMSSRYQEQKKIRMTTMYRRQTLAEDNLPQSTSNRKISTDATVPCKSFDVRDFVVCTKDYGVGYVDFIKGEFVHILNVKSSHATALSVHVEKPMVCIGYADGRLELVNFELHEVFARMDLRAHYTVYQPPNVDAIESRTEITVPTFSVSCLKFSPSGLHLACGLNNGELLFLDSTTIKLVTETPFKNTNCAIEFICYSRDSMSLAFYDSERTVCVYRYNCDSHIWQFSWKFRSHYKDITSLFFASKMNEDGYYKLLSFGEDRMMVEYDIGKSDEKCLAMKCLDRIEQTAVPLAALEWPLPADVDSDIPTILLANNENKYKIVNYNTMMTLATYLGPRYEYPVSKLERITKKEGNNEGITYMFFATKNVIGIQKLPLDGNPYKHVGILGHPNQLIETCFRADIGTLFTIGVKDECMCQWTVNYRSVESAYEIGGLKLDPYYCLLEDGRTGWLFREMRDLFYYIQILCQGTFSPAIRRVGDYIPIDSLPDLMRSLGFFPSEYEVENLITEAKFRIYEKQPSTEINFEQFVILYVNHRPAFGDNIPKIRNAFKTFATMIEDKPVMLREDLIDVLRKYGECFSDDLCVYLLSILCGHSFEDRASFPEGDFSFLPEQISFSDFMSDIIGIQDVDNLSVQPSIQESLYSQLTMSSTGIN